MPDRYDAVLNYLSARIFTRRYKTRPDRLMVDLHSRQRSCVSVDEMVEMNGIESRYPSMSREEIQTTLDELVAFHTVDVVDGGYRMRGWANPDACLPEPREHNDRIVTFTELSKLRKKHPTLKGKTWNQLWDFIEPNASAMVDEALA